MLGVTAPEKPQVSVTKADVPFERIREISREMGIPATHTPQILVLLAHAGLATARAGRGGGYRLSRDPSEIRLVEVVQAGEGRLRPDQCTLRGGPCRWDRMCALHPAWSAATDAFLDSLGSVTLDSMMNVDVALDKGTYPIAGDSHRSHAEGGPRVNGSIALSAGKPAS